MGGILNCEVCGQPATNGKRELREIEPKDGWRCYESIGLRLGCNEHPVTPPAFEFDGGVFYPRQSAPLP